MTYNVKSNKAGGGFYSIEGSDLIRAIEGNFNRIARDAQLGNAAGHRLVSARAEFKEGILGGKGGVALTIVHQGHDLAHREVGEESRKKQR